MTRQSEMFLIDLDGVIYSGGSLIPGADDTIRFLEEQGFPFRFISNTTRKSRSGIARRLAGMGIVIPEDKIFTPAASAAAYLSRAGRKSGYYLTTEEVADEISLSARVRQDPDQADVVVIGDAGDSLSYFRLNQAFRLLLQGAELVALEKDRFWMGSDGMMLSAGPFVAALEYASGKKALIVGKPAPEFFHAALDSMGGEPGCATMIGDDVETDIGGAISAGLSGILVKTGKYREETLVRAHRKPTAILDSIEHLPAYLAKRSGRE